MEYNDKFKQLCSSINYDTYINLQDTTKLFGAGLFLANKLILPQNPMLNNSIDVLALISLGAYFGLVDSHGSSYTKDVNQIRELYQGFIKNYNTLNEVFDLTNPVQIHTMFNYLLYKGYLSKNKSFEFSGTEARDIDSLEGINVIVGKAVCRHISPMLTDILNEKGIVSNCLGVYSKIEEIKIISLDKQKFTKEELINSVNTHVTDEETHSFIMKLIEELVDKRNQNIELSFETKDIKNPLKRKCGNHVITFAVKDEKGYYLDPTTSGIFRMSNSNNSILYDDDGELQIRLIGSIIHNNPKNYFEMKKRLLEQYPSITKEEEKAIVSETLNICNNNMDIFEKFYNENSELYTDISDKVLNIKNRRALYKKMIKY